MSIVSITYSTVIRPKSSLNDLSNILSMFKDPNSLKTDHLVNQLNFLCHNPQAMQKVQREIWTKILKIMVDRPHYDFWSSVQQIIHHLINYHNFVLPDELFAMAMIGKNYISDYQTACQIFSAYMDLMDKIKDPQCQLFVASSKFWGPLVMALVDLKKPTEAFQLACHIQKMLGKNAHLPSESCYLSDEQCYQLAKGLYESKHDTSIEAIDGIIQWLDASSKTIHATWIVMMKEIQRFRSKNIPFSVPLFIQTIEQKQLPCSEILDYQLYLMADPKDSQYFQLKSKCLLTPQSMHHEPTAKVRSLSGVVIWLQLIKISSSKSTGSLKTSIWDMVDIVLADLENVKRQIPSSGNFALWKNIISKMVAQSEDSKLASQVWYCYQVLFQQFGFLLDMTDVLVLLKAILKSENMSLIDLQQLITRIMACSETFVSRAIPLVLQRASEILSPSDFYCLFTSIPPSLHLFIPAALIRKTLANLRSSRQAQLKQLSFVSTMNWGDRWDMTIAYMEWLSKHDHLRPIDLSHGLYTIRDQVKSLLLLNHTLQNLHGFDLSLLKHDARQDALLGLVLNDCSEVDILQVLYELFPASNQFMYVIKILVALQKGYVEKADELLTGQKKIINPALLEELSSSLGIHLIERGEYEKLKRLSDFLIRHGQKISSLFAAQYLRALISRSHLEDAYDFVHYMREFLKKEKSSIVSSIYSDLVAALAKGKQTEKAENVINWMKQDGIELNTYSFSHIITMYSFLGNMAKAWKWLEAMIESKCLPTISTYASLMSGMLMHDDIDHLEKAMRHLKSRNIRPNSDVYSILLASLFRRGQAQKAMEMFNDTALPLCPWKCSAYAIVLDGMMENGADLSFLDGHLKRFKSSGLRMEPSFVASVVSAYCQFGLMSKAVEFITQTVNENGQECVSPTVYSKLLQGYLRNGYFDEAISLFNELLEDSIPSLRPDSNMFALVIHYLCVGDKMENAEEYFELALSREMDLTDTNVYATLIRYWAENRGQLEKCWKYYKLVKSIRLPTAIEFASILFGHRTLGKHRQMLVLANKIAPNPMERAHYFGYHGYYQLFMSLIALKRYPQAITMFNEIVSPEKANIYPRAEIYAILLELFKSKKKWNQVALLWKCMRPNLFETEGPCELELLNKMKDKLEIEYRIPREFQQLTSITEKTTVSFRQREPELYKRMLKVWITSIRHLTQQENAKLILKELESHLPDSLVLTLLKEYLSLSGYQEAFDLCIRSTNQNKNAEYLWKYCVNILQKQTSLEGSHWLESFTAYAESNHSLNQANSLQIYKNPIESSTSLWDMKEPSESQLSHNLKFLSNRGPAYQLQRIQGKTQVIILNTGLYSLHQYLAVASNCI